MTENNRATDVVRNVV